MTISSEFWDGRHSYLVAMVVILGASDGAKEIGMIVGLVVGSTAMLAASFAGPISGAFLNPARSLGLVNGAGIIIHFGSILQPPSSVASWV